MRMREVHMWAHNSTVVVSFLKSPSGPRCSRQPIKAQKHGVVTVFWISSAGIFPPFAFVPPFLHLFWVPHAKTLPLGLTHPRDMFHHHSSVSQPWKLACSVIKPNLPNFVFFSYIARLSGRAYTHVGLQINRTAREFDLARLFGKRADCWARVFSSFNK